MKSAKSWIAGLAFSNLAAAAALAAVFTFTSPEPVWAGVDMCLVEDTGCDCLCASGPFLPTGCYGVDIGEFRCHAGSQCDGGCEPEQQ